MQGTYKSSQPHRTAFHHNTQPPSKPTLPTLMASRATIADHHYHRNSSSTPSPLPSQRQQYSTERAAIDRVTIKTPEVQHHAPLPL